TSAPRRTGSPGSSPRPASAGGRCFPSALPERAIRPIAPARRSRGARCSSISRRSLATACCENSPSRLVSRQSASTMRRQPPSASASCGAPSPPSNAGASAPPTAPFANGPPRGWRPSRSSRRFAPRRAEHRGGFALDGERGPTVVAGVPPDFFSTTGQLWGNPHYRWSRLKQQAFRWWIDRFEHELERFDALRLDHFIGFWRVWQVPADAPTAEKGRWAAGPRDALFRRLRRRRGGRPPPHPEGPGLVTPEVTAL